MKSLMVGAALAATPSQAVQYQIPVNVILAPKVTDQYVDAIFKEAEKNLLAIGLDIKFQYVVRREALPGYDFANTSDVAARWDQAKKKSSWDVIFTPGGYGSTRRTLGKTNVTMAVNIDGGSHLFQHELGHALGFDGHLSEGDPFSVSWTYYGCEFQLPVKPYKDSGLPRQCANRTFLGHYSTGKPCPDNPYSWNVPYYRTIFRRIFECEASRWSAPIQPPPPKEEPKPPPAPEKNLHQSCPTWLDLVSRYKCE